MVEFNSDIMYHILSRMPVKSLYRFRCVCKLWYKYIDDPYLTTIHINHVNEDPMPIMLHKYTDVHHSPCRVTFLREVKSEEVATSLELIKDSVIGLPCDISRFSTNPVLGSCNGLILFLQKKSYGYTFFVIHPLRKECYMLPTINKLSSFNISDSTCGLGFNDFNNTFKIVCVLDDKNRGLCAVVHVLGTDTWREIHKIPSDLMSGEGIYAHGRVHWLASSHHYYGHAAQVIYFDIKKEEFGSINPPARTGYRWIKEQLADLNGEVGLSYTVQLQNKLQIEVWILKQKEWVTHCQVDYNWHLPKEDVMVIGFLNKDGDILISANKGFNLFVYRLKRDILHAAKIIGPEVGGESVIRMCQSDTSLIKYQYGEKLPVIKFR